MIQTWENGEKANFGPDLGSFSPIFFVSFTSTSSYKLLQDINLSNLYEK